MIRGHLMITIIILKQNNYGGIYCFMIVCIAGYYSLNSYGRLNNPDYADEKRHHIGVLIITGLILFSIIGALIFGGK